MPLNPRLRSHVQNNSFPQYAGGLLSDAGNSAKDWYSNLHPMDQAALATAPIPLLGDATGLLADARMFAQEPDSRTPMNFGLSAMGLLPFVPALSIAGRKAKTLNPKTVELAESMKAQGANRDEIWKATGEQYGQPSYFDPVDNSFRWEIDDSGARMQPIHEGVVSTRAEDAMAHNGLMAAYPDVGGTYMSKGANSYYSPSLNHIKISDTFPASNRVADKYSSLEDKLIGKHSFDLDNNWTPELEESIQASVDRLAKRGKKEVDRTAGSIYDKSTALHELNHAIQQREGFARGGQPYAPYETEHMVDTARSLRDDLESQWQDAFMSSNNKRMEAVSGELEKANDQFARAIKLSSNPHYDYKRLLGEADSRAVQERMNLNPRQRIDRPFWKDYDVPEDEFIRRYEGLLSESQPLTEFEQAHAKGLLDTSDDFIYAGTGGKQATEILPYGVTKNSAGARQNNLFGGVFGSLDESVAGSHGKNIQKYKLANHAKHDELKHEVFYSDDAIKHDDTFRGILKDHKEAADITDDEVAELLDYVMGEKHIEQSLPDMGLERYNDIMGTSAQAGDYEALSDLGWDHQGLKGELARRMGYDSVGMPDEHGESILILNGVNENAAPKAGGQMSVPKGLLGQ